MTPMVNAIVWMGTLGGNVNHVVMATFHSLVVNAQVSIKSNVVPILFEVWCLDFQHVDVTRKDQSICNVLKQANVHVKKDMLAQNVTCVLKDIFPLLEDNVF